tara:strand:+ start:585 stop:941 length:357 start_codon:yes stop_codon:yes gene_type:complete
MNQSLFLEYDNGTIGVVRNPYERLVSLYRDSWDYIGFDKWIDKSNLKSQVELYSDCANIITLEHWEQDLIALDIEPKNSSILMEQTISADYKRWYTNKSLLIVARLIKPDLDTYGYTY